MTTYESDIPCGDIPATTITEFILARADALGDKPAFIDGGSGRTLTYAGLKQQIQSLAGGLQARGVGKGTTWALMLPNLPEFAVAFHGLAWAGATVTTLNPTYAAKEIAYQLKDAGASGIITVGLFLDVARAAAEEAGISEVVVIGPGDATPFTELFGPPLAEHAPVDVRQDVVVLPYSSGTTGFPKGVMLTHHNLVANLVQTEGHIDLGEDEVCFAVLPFFHIYGMQVLMNFTVSRGVTTICVPRFDLVQMLELTQRHRITRLYLVPPIVLALAKHPIIDNYDLSSVREIFSGAAPLGGEIADAAAARLGCSVAQGYGMTELSPVATVVRMGDAKAGSVGTLLAGTQARIVDPESGRAADPGGRGELWIRGPQVMSGYLNNPDATAQTIDGEGWLHTGDIGYIDDAFAHNPLTFHYEIAYNGA